MKIWIRKREHTLLIRTSLDPNPFEFLYGENNHLALNKKGARLTLFLCLIYDYTSMKQSLSVVPDFINEVWRNKEKYDLLL